MQVYSPLFLYWIKENVLRLLFSGVSTIWIWQILCNDRETVSTTLLKNWLLAVPIYFFHLYNIQSDHPWYWIYRSEPQVSRKAVHDAKFINLVQRAQSHDWSQVTRLVAIYTNICQFCLHMVLELISNFHQRYCTRNVDSSKVYPVKLTNFVSRIEKCQYNPALRLAVTNAKICPFLLCRRTFHSFCTE